MVYKVPEQTAQGLFIHFMGFSLIRRGYLHRVVGTILFLGEVVVAGFLVAKTLNEKLKMD